VLGEVNESIAGNPVALEGLDQVRNQPNIVVHLRAVAGIWGRSTLRPVITSSREKVLFEHDVGLGFVGGGDVMPEPLLNQPPKETTWIAGGFGGRTHRGAHELEAVVFAPADEPPFLGLPV
jgi:hypothetical protein